MKKKHDEAEQRRGPSTTSHALSGLGTYEYGILSRPQVITPWPPMTPVSVPPNVIDHPKSLPIMQQSTALSRVDSYAMLEKILDEGNESETSSETQARLSRKSKPHTYIHGIYPFSHVPFLHRRGSGTF